MGLILFERAIRDRFGGRCKAVNSDGRVHWYDVATEADQAEARKIASETLPLEDPTYADEGERARIRQAWDDLDEVEAEVEALGAVSVVRIKSILRRLIAAQRLNLRRSYPRELED